MQRPCAYCKENGHHIRECSSLAEKNRRQESKPQLQVMPKYVPPPMRKSEPVVAKNKFSDLYSSSDEEELEEGEIYEEKRVRPVSRPIVISDESSSGEEVVQQKWTRSGIKGIHIPMCQPEQNSMDDAENEFNHEYISDAFASMKAYLDKYRNRSWADMDSDSDSE